MIWKGRQVGSYPGMNHYGFTLIELVMVIIILGILSAVAIPRYMDLQAEARSAAAESALGTSASACAINYAARQTKAVPPAALGDCNLLQSAVDSTGISIAPGAAGECDIVVDNVKYSMLFTAETDSSPCVVQKSIGKWPN